MPKLIDVIVPVGQAEGTESVVSTWFKSVGDSVSENEPLLEISTDKVNMEVASPGSGRLVEILKSDGDQVDPGEVLGRIDSEVAAAASAPAEAPPSPTSQADGTEKPGASTAGGSGELSPAVRKLLKEHNLDATQIKGTGKGGRITADDVMSHAQAAGSRQPSQAAGSGQQEAIKSHRVKHSQMRRSIAQHMVQSVAAAPHVTSVFDADLSNVVKHRDANKADFDKRGAKLTFTAYFVKATVDALKAVPEVNSRWHDDALEIYDDINIGIATALGSGGLIVPVIAKAQDLDLFGIAERLQDLTDRARNEKLDPRDVQNGTFTISNHGVSGSLIASPIIINQPQSAILGVGKMERRVVPMSDVSQEVVVKPMCYVTLTIDHRVLDGFQANQFLTSWVGALSEF
ncbi:MAG TPA: 2-oxo acid dehydrogenase subunit E2 [Gemmatimonadaceae bacterium]|nr:2-oxo acid dehydrogenase subunit E2 [Gemmatimonadaceae bacterium]